MNNLFHLLLLLQLVLLPVPLARAQCVLPTEEVITDLLMTHLAGVEFNLTQSTISCLSSGGIRDMYQQASIIVVIVSDVAIEGCPPSTGGCTGFFHIVCADNTPMWVLSEISPPDTLQLADEADPNLAAPRTDCGACSYLGFVTPGFSDRYDAETHCYGKIYYVRVRVFVCMHAWCYVQYCKA